MPSFKDLSIDSPLSVKRFSRSPRPTFRDVASKVMAEVSVVRKWVDALASDPNYMTSVGAAIKEDNKYKWMYEEYLRTHKVAPLYEADEEFSLLRFRTRSGGPGGPPKEGDYDDEHVYVCTARRTLTVHHWLSLHPTLVIDLDRIIRLRPAHDEVACGGVEAWGVGTTGVAWARDADRTDANGSAFNRSYVCEFKAEGDEEEYCAGFTVEDPAKFARVIEGLCPGIRAGYSRTRWVR